MSMNDELDFGVYEAQYGTFEDYNYIEENVPDTNQGPQSETRNPTFSGAVDPFLQDSDHNHQSLNQTNDDIFYKGHETLFCQQLILLKRFRAHVDVRYKTDYFPRSGPNVGKPQRPRYLLMEDESQEVIIKLPNNIVLPPKPDQLYLQVALLTLPYANRYHLHVHKFQLDHNNVEVPDENPFYIRLTKEHFRLGEIRIKLVLIKTRQNELKKKLPLPIFCEASTTTSDQQEQVECKSPIDIIETYQLKRAMVAFTLGYRKSETEFVQFTNTTVISDEIIEKEKSGDLDEIICPHCSGHISIRELKEKEKRKKRSLSASDAVASKKH